jgi:hypothetical protein
VPGFTPISEDFLGNPLEFEQGLGQGYDDFTLDELVAVLPTLPPIISYTVVTYSRRRQ